jgi:large subunit ribosomal protein L24
MLKYKKIKKKDLVKVIKGKNIGKSGTVLEVDREKGSILIEGVNMVKKTMRKSKKDPQGGIKEIEAFIDVSKVMLICPKCKAAVRVGIKVENGEKKRFCKKCKGIID